MGRIGVVLNPYARRNRYAPGRAEQLGAVLDGAGRVVVTESLAELDEAARRFRDESVDIVATCGGDGTLFRTVTALRHAFGTTELPMLLPLRAGTINRMAASIDCAPGSPERVLGRVVEATRNGSIPRWVERDLIEVNGRHYGFIFGLGVGVKFLSAYDRLPKPGPVAATRLLARAAASALFGTRLAREILRPVGARVTCEGELLPFRELRVFFAMTVEDLPLGFRPAYRAGEPGRFHVLAGPIPGRRIVRNLWRFRRGLPVEDPELHDFVAQDVVVELDEPTPYMVDADILDPVERIHLTTGPSVRLVQG